MDSNSYLFQTPYPKPVHDRVITDRRHLNDLELRAFDSTLLHLPPSSSLLTAGTYVDDIGVWYYLQAAAPSSDSSSTPEEID